MRNDCTELQRQESDHIYYHCPKHPTVKDFDKCMRSCGDYCSKNALEEGQQELPING